MGKYVQSHTMTLTFIGKGGPLLPTHFSLTDITKMVGTFSERYNVDFYFICITAYQAYSWCVSYDSGILSYTGKSNYNA